MAVMAAIPLMMAAAAAVSGAAGQVMAGMSQSAADRANALAADNQASAEGKIIKMQTEQQIGRQAAGYGASGVVAGTGSPLAVMADTAMKGELSRRLALYRGAVTAASDTYDAKNASIAGVLGGFTTLLTGGAQFAQNLQNMNNTQPQNTDPQQPTISGSSTSSSGGGAYPVMPWAGGDT